MVVFYTLVDDEMRHLMQAFCDERGMHAVDLMGGPISALEKASGLEASRDPGLMRTVDQNYFRRIAAMEFTVEHDDGRAECYEVEFLAGATEYQYEIDLYTGAVLKSERESHSVPASGSSGPHIGEAAAKSAALTHAGVSESDASRIQVELDRDDGRTLYEVEFHVGRTEYSYEIDAASGAVLKAEQEIDD